MKKQVLCLILPVFAFVALCAAQEGTRVFIDRCIQCHDPNSEVHAPTAEALSVIPWQSILKTLQSGAMKSVGDQISAADRVAVSRYLGKVELNSAPPVAMSGECAGNLKPKAGNAWNGWGADPQNTRFQTAKAAGLTADQLPSPRSLALPVTRHSLRSSGTLKLDADLFQFHPPERSTEVALEAARPFPDLQVSPNVIGRRQFPGKIITKSKCRNLIAVGCKIEHNGISLRFLCLKGSDICFPERRVFVFRNARPSGLIGSGGVRFECRCLQSANKSLAH